MRDRNPDAAHFLQLVRQHALVEQLVPVLDPGGAGLGLRTMMLTTRGSGAPVRLADSIMSRSRDVFSFSSMYRSLGIAISLV